MSLTRPVQGAHTDPDDTTGTPSGRPIEEIIVTPAETTPFEERRRGPAVAAPSSGAGAGPATTGRRPFVVACLTGHGVGPEMMAGASRALAEVSRQHGFAVEQVHPPFAGEAMTQTGHPLPAATRAATLRADAILAAGAVEPALEDVKAELDLGARMVRIVLDDGRDLTLIAPLHESSEAWTLERAFLTARARSGRVASVAVSADWRTEVARHAARHDGVTVTDVSLADALEALANDPAFPGVVLVERVLAEAVFAAPRLAGRRHLSATGFLSSSGPGLFTPHHEHASDGAGQGMADPSEALLAAALLLGEGLGRRSAAEALDESLAATLSAPRRAPDRSGSSVSATTREFVDAVLGLLPSARRDTEFALGVGR